MLKEEKEERIEENVVAAAAAAAASATDSPSHLLSVKKHKGEHTLATKKKKKKQKNRANCLDSVCVRNCVQGKPVPTLPQLLLLKRTSIVCARKKEENGSLFGCLRGAITASLFAPMQQQRARVHQRMGAHSAAPA